MCKNKIKIKLQSQKYKQKIIKIIKNISHASCLSKIALSILRFFFFSFSKKASNTKN